VFDEGLARAPRLRSKRIALLTYGSRGDVEPFVALGGALKDAGADVVLAAPEVFRGFAAAYGLEFRGLAGDPKDLARQLVEHAGLSRARQIRVMARHVMGIAREVYAELREVCRGASCIVHSFLMTSSGHLLAADAGIPEVSAQLFPVFSPTTDFAAPTFPDLPLGPGYRWLTHALNSLVYWEGGRLMYARLRSQDRSLPRYPRWPFGALGRVPILYAYSPAVLPTPASWGPRARVTGYWFLDPPAPWKPPEDLVRFLEAGPPPVFVGLGSMLGKRANRVALEAARALKALGRRSILSFPEGVLEGADLPPNAHRVVDIPHSWLFPKMAAIVHHGGAGTTGAALRAGRPSVVVPLTADQAFWGRRVSRLGAGPPPLSGARLTSASLAAAIHTALTDPSLETRARELGRQIAAEDGVGQAVAEIGRLIAPI
jgi:sterol 3beta-glucosyltransferase